MREGKKECEGLVDFLGAVKAFFCAVLEKFRRKTDHPCKRATQDTRYLVLFFKEKGIMSLKVHLKTKSNSFKIRKFLQQIVVLSFLKKKIYVPFYRCSSMTSLLIIHETFYGCLHLLMQDELGASLHARGYAYLYAHKQLHAFIMSHKEI